MPPLATSAAQTTIASWNASTDARFGANVLSGQLRGDERADRGDPDQPCDAGDRVVDRRRNPGIAFVGVGEHGCRERRNGGRQPQREEDERREEVVQVRGVDPRPEEEQDARCRQQRPDGEEQPRAVAVGQCAHPAGEREHGQGRRDRRQPRLQRRVSRNLLEEDEQEEEQDRQARVDREGLQVGDREVPALEQIESQHRMRGALLVEDERSECDDADQERDDDRWASPAEPGLFDQGEDDSGQTERAEAGTDQIDATSHPRRVRNRGPHEQQRDQNERDVEREDPAPRRLVDDQAAHAAGRR